MSERGKYAADELRVLASVFERRADSVVLCRDGKGQERRVAMLDCADEARDRANELDPDGKL
jgi:hypothetical protein